jgi:predicted nucleotidyltransferase component of viral defense system
MEMPEYHRRVLDAALDTCYTHGLVLAGGYAMRAHGLVDRPSQDIDFATFSASSLEETADALAAAYRAAGFDVATLRGTPLLARLMVSDPLTGQSCAVDLMKMPLQQPSTMVEVYPVASVDDIAGMKVAALHGRSVPRDLIDLWSVADGYGFPDLERLGFLFEVGFRLETAFPRHRASAIRRPDRAGRPGGRRWS